MALHNSHPPEILITPAIALNRAENGMKASAISVDLNSNGQAARVAMAITKTLVETPDMIAKSLS